MKLEKLFSASGWLVGVFVWFAGVLLIASWVGMVDPDLNSSHDPAWRVSGGDYICPGGNHVDPNYYGCGHIEAVFTHTLRYVKIFIWEGFMSPAIAVFFLSEDGWSGIGPAFIMMIISPYIFIPLFDCVYTVTRDRLLKKR